MLSGSLFFSGFWHKEEFFIFLLNFLILSYLFVDSLCIIQSFDVQWE